MPAQADFSELVSAANNTNVIDAWGYGGTALATLLQSVTGIGAYWSVTKVPPPSEFLAYYLNYNVAVLRVDTIHEMYYGMQVRCVK
jgi:hypothetical protein